MSEYILKQDNTGVQAVFRVVDSAWIPLTEDNRDYKQYLKWVEEGGVADVETY